MKYTPKDPEEEAQIEKIPVSFRQVSWGPIAAVLLTFVFFFASQVIAVIALILVAMVLDGQTIQSLQESGGPLATTVYQFAGTVLVAIALFGLIFAFLRYKKTSIKALGFYKFNWKKFASYGAIGLLVYLTANIVASIAINAIWPEILKTQQDIGFDRASTGVALVPIFISLVVIPPLIEEILSRGFLFGGLRQKLSFVPAVLITSAIFALAHLAGGESQSLVWAAVIDTFMLSLVLCWLRERTGSLWAPMLLHGIKNGLAFSTIFIFR